MLATPSLTVTAIVCTPGVVGAVKVVSPFGFTVTGVPSSVAVAVRPPPLPSVTTRTTIGSPPLTDVGVTVRVTSSGAFAATTVIVQICSA